MNELSAPFVIYYALLGMWHDDRVLCLFFQHGYCFVALQFDATNRAGKTMMVMIMMMIHMQKVIVEGLTVKHFKVILILVFFLIKANLKNNVQLF